MDDAATFEAIVQPASILSLVAGESDRQLAWNMLQIAASLRLISHFFGEEWYRSILQRVEHEGLLPNPRLRRILRSDSQPSHPLTKDLWSGLPQHLIRVVHLAISLKVLGLDHPQSNVHLKLPELRSTSFAKAYYELKAAATYATAGFRVVFLRPAEGLKTPDFLVTDTNGTSAPVECKKRDTDAKSSIKVRANGVLDRLRDANSQLKQSGTPGICWIEVDDSLSREHPDLRIYQEYISAELPLLTSTHCVLLTWENVVAQTGVTHIFTGAIGMGNPGIQGTFPRDIWCNPNQIGHSFPSHLVDLPGEEPPATQPL